jgi:hypothetical protein
MNVDKLSVAVAKFIVECSILLRLGGGEGCTRKNEKRGWGVNHQVIN